MTDERIDVTSDDDEVPSVATLPDLIVEAPVNRSITSGLSDLWFKIPASGDHQVWLQRSMNGQWSYITEGQWYKGNVRHWAPFFSDRPGQVRLKAWWRSGPNSSKVKEIDVWISNLPVIVDPAENAVIYDRKPKIVGIGGGDCTLEVMKDDWVLGDKFTAVNNAWDVRISEAGLTSNLAFAQHSIAIKQSASGYITRYSELRTFTIVGAAITFPMGVEPNHQLIFKGEANAGAIVHVVSATNHWNVFSTTVTVPESGRWEAPLTATVLSGDVSVQAQYILTGAPLDYSAAVTFRVLGVPAITSPAVASEQEMSFTLTGNNGLAEAKVEIYEDGLNVKVGESSVLTGATWTVQVDLKPGPRSLVALQLHSGKQSLRGAPRPFKIRPPKLPSITVTYPNETTVRLSGTAYNAAGADTKVHIHYRSNSSPALPDVAVSNGNWTKDITGLLPSNSQYAFDVQQSVTDGVGGRIRNTGWTEALVTVNTPMPTLNTPFLSGQIPTFSGTRNVWGGAGAGDIQIQLNGQIHALLPNPQGSVTSWSITATGKIAPDSYTVSARQGINSRWSEFKALAAPLIIKPDLPELSSPAAGVETPQNGQFRGKTWPNAKVVVRFKSGGLIKEFYSNANTGEWSFDYTLPLGLVEVEVLSTFGGQTSAVKSQSFPVKTPPPTITSPTVSDNEVAPRPVIKGIGIAGCWVHVYSANTTAPLGRAQVGPDNKWTVTLDEQDLGDLRIYTKQFFNTIYESNETDALLIKVVVPTPAIEAPGNGTRPARTFTVSGKGGWPGGVIDLTLNGQPSTYKDIAVQADGSWQVAVTSVVGTLDIKAVQRYKGVLSKDSLGRSVTVVPAVPVIDTPREGELMSKTVVFSGFGYAGDSVKLYRRGLPFEMHGPVRVSPQGTWSFSLSWAEPGKPFTVTVEQIATGNYVSVMSPNRNFTLLSTAPTITAPVEGDWVGVRPEFSGLATPGATISVASWFDTANLLAASTEANDDGRWKVVGNKTLPIGAVWVVVRQTLGGTVSEWAESGRFMVE